MTTIAGSLPQNESNVSYQEVRIPVPWGYIAGKWWGPQDKQPILTLHGWQDNCGTFDLLIPSLPKHLSYLAIDLPGHGYSSWLPPGIFYHEMDYVITIRHLQKFMGWNKMSFMGHSMGATVCYAYGLVYPQEVNFIICLDGLQPRVNVYGAASAQNIIEDFFKYSEQPLETTPCYTLEEMQELHVRSWKIDLDKVQYFVKRGIKEGTGGRYRFARDPRLKSALLVTWSGETIKARSGIVKFPLLLVMYNEHLYGENIEIFRETLEVLKECNEKFHCVKIQGGHLEHLNDHSKFTQIVTDFIVKYAKSQICAPIIDKIKCNF